MTVSGERAGGCLVVAAATLLPARPFSIGGRRKSMKDSPVERSGDYVLEARTRPCRLCADFGLPAAGEGCCGRVGVGAIV